MGGGIYFVRRMWLRGRRIIGLSKILKGVGIR